MGGPEQPSKLKSDKNFARAQVPMIQYTIEAIEALEELCVHHSSGSGLSQRNEAPWANENRSVCQEACLTNEVVQQIEGSTDPGSEGQ